MSNHSEEEDSELTPGDSISEKSEEFSQTDNAMQNQSITEQLSTSKYSSDEIKMSTDMKSNQSTAGPSLSDEVVMVLQEQTGWVCNGSICTDLGPIYDRQKPSDGNILFIFIRTFFKDYYNLRIMV